MAFRLTRDETIEVGVRRVACELLDDALGRLSALESRPDANDVGETVHEVRKRCKELRGLLRLVREPLGEEFGRADDLTRRAARELSSIRDAHALEVTFSQLRRSGADAGLDGVTEAQSRAAESATAAVLGGDPRVGRAANRLRKVRSRLVRWRVPDRFDALAPGLGRTYRQGRRGLDRAADAPNDEHFHEWRRSVKHLWYQLRLLEPVAPSVLSPAVARLDDLARALGDDHDLAVLAEQMTERPKRFGPKKEVRRAVELARAEQDELRRRALRLGARIYAEPPDAFTDRVGRYWRIDRNLGEELVTGGIADLAELDEVGEPAPDPISAATIERQRRFVVGAVPRLPRKGERIRQGYLAVDRSVSVRVRDSSEGRSFTLKGGRGAVRTEVEFEIGADDFEALWPFTEGRGVAKTRYAVPVESHTALVDVFEGDLAGLCTVEVEFSSEQEMTDFEPPDWFGREVTGDPRWANASLAAHGPPTGAQDPLFDDAG